MLRTILAAAALTFAATIATPTLAGDQPMPRILSLAGHGEVRMAPDMAVVTIGVMSQATTADQAVAANTASMQTIFAALKAAAIDAKDIQTSNFTVQPRYQYNNEGKPPRLDGYDVSNTVTVIVRKLDSLGGVLDRAVTAGSNQINGIQFQVSKPDAALDEARKLAVADARRKAEVYAAASGVTLGAIQSLSEGAGYEPPVPLVRAKAMRAEMQADVPIAQGEQALAVDVNIVWDIK